jgi:hypothetical protein
MERDEFETALNQLAAAADLLATSAPADEKMSAQQTRAFFRLRQARLSDPATRQTSDDELFKSTAHAALDMAGRKEYLAATLLLDQARSLLKN